MYIFILININPIYIPTQIISQHNLYPDPIHIPTQFSSPPPGPSAGSRGSVNPNTGLPLGEGIADCNQRCSGRRYSS